MSSWPSTATNISVHVEASRFRHAPPSHDARRTASLFGGFKIPRRRSDRSSRCSTRFGAFERADAILQCPTSDGFGQLAGETGDAKLALKGVTVGAQIGGSSERGLGLVLGLSSPRAFGGDDSGTAAAATMAEAGTAMNHDIRISQRAGKGFSV